VTLKNIEMKKTDSPCREAAENRRKASELERKKKAWSKYEKNIRNARSGYSELELDDN